MFIVAGGNPPLSPQIFIVVKYFVDGDVNFMCINKIEARGRA